MELRKLVGKLLLIGCLLSGLFSCSFFSRYSGQRGVTYVAPNGNPPAYSLAWSPQSGDDLLISSRSLAMGNGQVQILDLRTKHASLITQAKYGDLLGSDWSPDGKSIVLSVGNKTLDYPKPGLWLYNTGENTKRLLTERTGTAVWLANRAELAVFTVDFASEGQPRRLSIYLVDVEAATERLIYSNPNAVSFWGASASPDGNTLAFSLHTGDATASDIFVLDLRDGQTSQLTRNQGSTMPAWSPSADIIAYEVAHNQLGQTVSSLHLITTEGKCDTEIPQLRDVSSPTWSPDGKELAFIGPDGIYVIDLLNALGRDIGDGLCPGS